MTSESNREPDPQAVDQAFRVAKDLVETHEARERARRRTQLLIGGAVGVAAIAAGVWYFALRDTRTACDKAIGSLADLETLLGEPASLEYRYDGKYSCSQTVTSRSAANRRTLVDLRIEEHAYSSDLDPAKFATVIPFEVITGGAKLYVAGNEPEPDPQALLDDAIRRSATTRRGGDPMGEALAALPETRHVAIAKVGGRHLRIAFDRRITPDAAQAYTAAAIMRAR